MAQLLRCLARSLVQMAIYQAVVGEEKKSLFTGQHGNVGEEFEMDASLGTTKRQSSRFGSARSLFRRVQHLSK